MVRSLPLSSVVPLVKVTVPKSSRGTSVRRPAVGDSSIHSAEESDDAYVRLFWKDCPEVVSWITIFQVPSACRVIDTLTVSPAATSSGTVWEARGSVSHQAE